MKREEELKEVSTVILIDIAPTAYLKGFKTKLRPDLQYNRSNSIMLNFNNHILAVS